MNAATIPKCLTRCSTAQQLFPGQEGSRGPHFLLRACSFLSTLFSPSRSHITEQGNLRNLHSQKFSGLANKQAGHDRIVSPTYLNMFHFRPSISGNRTRLSRLLHAGPRRLRVRFARATLRLPSVVGQDRGVRLVLLRALQNGITALTCAP